MPQQGTPGVDDVDPELPSYMMFGHSWLAVRATSIVAENSLENYIVHQVNNSSEPITLSVA